MGIHNTFGFHQEQKGLRNPKKKNPKKSNMKVFTTVCTMVALASAESQLLIAQNNVDYTRVPNVGKTRFEGYVDYIPYTRRTQPMISSYQQLPVQQLPVQQLPVQQLPAQLLMGQRGSVQQYTTTTVPYTSYHATPLVTMRLKREAEAEATHAQAYKSKVTDPNGGSYELEVQVNRDGEGQSFQRHEQKTTTTNQQQQRIEEQLYHNMMNARNMDQLQRFNEVMMNDQNRFAAADQHRRQQQHNTQYSSHQLLNQLINNQIQNQRTGSFNRFFQLQQQRPTYSHRLINSKNNQQRQQYIREKLNNFGQRKSQQQQDGHRMFKREAEPSMVTYGFATSQPSPVMPFDTLRNNIYSNMNINQMNTNDYGMMVYGLRQPVMAIRQAKLNAESMKEIHPEGTMSLRKIYNNDIYQLGRNYGYETMVDLSNH